MSERSISNTSLRQRRNNHYGSGYYRPRQSNAIRNYGSRSDHDRGSNRINRYGGIGSGSQRLSSHREYAIQVEKQGLQAGWFCASLHFINMCLYKSTRSCDLTMTI